MTSTCITSLDLCAIRVAKVTSGGAPIIGVNNGYMSDAPVSLGVSIETDSGETVTLRDGCANLILAHQQPDQIRSVKFDLSLCQLDADLAALMTGAQLFVDGSDNAIGQQTARVGGNPPPVCFEAWTKAWDVGGHQLVHAQTAPADTWIHWVFPFTHWVQGTLTFEHDLLTIPMSGVGAENPQMTASGPFNDWPLLISTAGGVTRVAGWFFDDSPPPATCTYLTTGAGGLNIVDGDVPSDTTIEVVIDGDVPSDTTIEVTLDGGAP